MKKPNVQFSTAITLIEYASGLERLIFPKSVPFKCFYGFITYSKICVTRVGSIYNAVCCPINLLKPSGNFKYHQV
jgi:hypothetical protein